MEDPAVSVIMPAFNAEETISESINSVLEQSYHSWELIVIDDASSDGTASIVQHFQESDPRIILIKLPKNGGLSNARNEGCRIAKGDFIAFLDSDDVWRKDKLSIQISFHFQHRDIEISHTDFLLFNNTGIIRRPFKHIIHWKKHKQGLLYPTICYKNPIGILTVMVKKQLMHNVNFFDTSLWTMEDQDLWIKVAKLGKKFGYISAALSYYRIASRGITSKTGKYKRAYKFFIRKVSASNKLNHNLLYRYYYLYFGTLYFKKEEYKLSRLYFWKSIRLVPYDHVALSTLGYIVKGSSKCALQTLTLRIKRIFESAFVKTR